MTDGMDDQLTDWLIEGLTDYWNVQPDYIHTYIFINPTEWVTDLLGTADGRNDWLVEWLTG